MLPRRATAYCRRCRVDLEKTSGRSIDAALACAFATLVLLFPVNMLPLVRMDMLDMQSRNVISTSVFELLDQRWVLLAGITGLFVILLPFLRFVLLVAVLGALRLGLRGTWLGPTFRWSLWLDPWAMMDVFLLAAGVGYYRLANTDQAQVSIQIGGACFIAVAILTMLSRATLDKRTVWRAIGGESGAGPGERTVACTTCDLVQPLSRSGQLCPRCRARLRIRKPDAMAWTTALSVAAFILFFPANLYPLDLSTTMGSQDAYTIFRGIQGLFSGGQWPLGALVFCTSILIPITKILAIGWCLVSVWRRSNRHLVTKTKVLRAVAEFGRWSKTDPFAIVFFVPLLHFGEVASGAPGGGATAFLIMSVLTMVASYTFDPRLMWDAAEAGRHE